MFNELCFDVAINGDILRVTQSSTNGEYRSVSFGSEIEFECFLQLEFRRAANANA